MRMTMSLLFAIVLTAAFSLTALAQQEPSATPGSDNRPETRQQMTPEKFNTVKARLLQRIEQQRTVLDQEKACVEAATTPAELRKCRHARRMEMRPGPRGQRGPEQQLPPQSPAVQTQ